LFMAADKVGEYKLSLEFTAWSKGNWKKKLQFEP
jgi:hypothetical protein